MAKIHKVAELAGVSTATVSRALAGKSTVSDATRERVEAAAKELGYVVSSSASSLASGRTRNVGIVLPHLRSWFYMAVLRGAQLSLADAGYDVTLYHLAEDDDTAAEGDNPRRARLFDEFLRRKRVDALIAISLDLTENEVALLAQLRRPVVGIGGPLPGIHTMSLDDTAVATAATMHLVELGHRSIAHLSGGPSFDVGFHPPANRRAGWEAALQSAGIEPDPLLLREGDFTIKGGYDATVALLDDPHVSPTAIFAASDEMAFGAMMAVRDRGLRVPEDISVIGIDGHELSEVFGLTTVDQFPEVQGRHAAEIVLHELDKAHHESMDESLPWELVARRSTATRQ